MEGVPAVHFGRRTVHEQHERWRSLPSRESQLLLLSSLRSHERTTTSRLGTGAARGQGQDFTVRLVRPSRGWPALSLLRFVSDSSVVDQA